MPQMTCRIEDLALGGGDERVVVLTVGKLTCLSDVGGIVITVSKERHIQERQTKSERADEKEEQNRVGTRT